MTSALQGIYCVQQQGVTGTYVSSDGNAYFVGPCGHCSGTQHIVLARDTGRPSSVATLWLRCVNCLCGSVREGGVISPSSKPLREPVGLPAADQAVWSEVRTCLGAGAYNAAVMLCRKLLFHLAVSSGLPAKDSNDRAPSYAQAVAHLESEGVITRKMLSWVERIKDVGNEVNHEIEAVSADLALDVATFTEQLLVLAYELDALMDDPTAALAAPLPDKDE